MLDHSDGYLVQVGFAGDCFVAQYGSAQNHRAQNDQSEIVATDPGTVPEQVSYSAERRKPSGTANPEDSCLSSMNPTGELIQDSSIARTPTSLSLSPRDQVLVQTPRGVELGTVMNRISESPSSALRILRRVTREDSMLIERLRRHKTEAVQRCQEVLAQSESDAVLLDVDHLFDGNSLVLHFLGPVDALGRELTDEIVRQYEAEVQSIRLSELMNHGCGPGCGDDAAEGSGCGTKGGCATCSVACK